MTAQQTNVIKHINDQHEAQRFIASQASRDVAELDVRSVLLVVKAKIEAGRIDEAKAIVKQWKAGQL